MALPRQLDALGAVVAMLARVQDPEERVRAIVAVRREVDRESDRLRDLLRETVLELRALDRPHTWEQIGVLLGLSTQGAYQFAARTIQITEQTPTTESTTTP